MNLDTLSPWSDSIRHFLYKHLRTENNINWGRKRKIKNKEKWDYCHHTLILPLLGTKHRLPLLHMTKIFICIEKSKECIDEFYIEYMINPKFHVNKSFIDQVEKCMNTKFGTLTKPFIKTT